MAAKFQRFSARGTFSSLELNGKGRKTGVFQGKIGHISKTVRDTANVAINH